MVFAPLLEGLRKPNETIAARRGYVLCLGALPRTSAARCAGPAWRLQVLEALTKEALNQDLPGGKEQEEIDMEWEGGAFGRLLVRVRRVAADIETFWGWRVTLVW